MAYGIEELMDQEGFDFIEQLIEEYGYDSTVPCICTECGAVEYWEPDCRDGYCTVCDSHTVQSFMVLLGVI